ncbi:riboflavin synthase [Flavobacteriaceae bacterium UJ101]|nr:riboflavin synthase [Flavobacteriaceae bacterium UJ101]
MFTGIIEDLGKVTHLAKDQDNLHITVQSSFTEEIKIDQSIAHNGVCLTVIDIKNDEYTVTAIKETLEKTNLNSLKTGDEINLERCLKVGGRLDGHMVQGHVDQTATCVKIEDANGSTFFTFEYVPQGNTTVEKGSVCVNGISLTVINSTQNQFSVAIIPYTIEHTNLKHIKVGDLVNIEFDILGKYIAKLMHK